MELFELSDLVLIPTGGLLVSKELLNAAAIGQFLGLLLFGVGTFLTLPEVFPDEYLDWGNDIVGRAIVATGIVGASLLFNGLVAQLPFFDGGSFNPVATVLWLIGISSLAGLLTALYKTVGVPQWRPLPNRMGYRELAGHDTGVPRVGLLVSRVLLILVFGGFALAAVPRLYPVPELFLIGATVYKALFEHPPFRTDVAEGFIAGLRSIWAGPRGVLGVSYGIGGLLFVAWLGVAYTVGLENRAEVVGDPVTLLFGLTTLVAGTLHATMALVRLVERLPRAFGDSLTSADKKPPIPGLLLPSAALLGWYVVQNSSTGGDSYSVSATVPELGVALTLGALALVALRAPASGPYLPFSDYHRIALAPSLLFGIWVTTAIVFSDSSPIVSGGSSLISLLVGIYSFTMLALSPFLGYELFLSDEEMSETPDLSTLASKTFVAAVVLLVGSFISVILNRVAALLPHGEILPLIGGATFVLPPLAAVIIQVALILFYVPEQIPNWFR